MTKQEVFTQVATHLLTQKEQAYNEGAGCRYRDESGRKCAVGCLIPDELYSPELEGISVADFHSRSFTVPKLRSVAHYLELSTNLDLLIRLQSIHDTMRPTRWEEQLTRLARAHNLQMPVFTT